MIPAYRFAYCQFLAISVFIDIVKSSTMLYSTLLIYQTEYSQVCSFITLQHIISFTKWNPQWMENILRGYTPRIDIRSHLFSVFINDLFYFVEKCEFYHANDNSMMSHLANAIENVCSALEHDGEIAWFESNGMQTNTHYIPTDVLCLPSRQDPYL